jgi:hypothetical protein
MQNYNLAEPCFRPKDGTARFRPTEMEAELHLMKNYGTAFECRAREVSIDGRYRNYRRKLHFRSPGCAVGYSIGGKEQWSLARRASHHNCHSATGDLLLETVRRRPPHIPNLPASQRSALHTLRNDASIVLGYTDKNLGMFAADASDLSGRHSGERRGALARTG